MKVLLSAHACQPGQGSEPGVGWNWAITLAAMGHEVTVLTTVFNQAGIETYRRTKGLPHTLHFEYVGVPWWRGGDRAIPRMIRTHYLAWQWYAYRHASRLVGVQHFDVVHHVTWTTVRYPSLMGNLGIPFILGPVSGGEPSPLRLRKGYSWRGWLYNFLRDLWDLWIRLDPLVSRMFRQADIVFVSCRSTIRLLPPRYRNKALVRLAICADILDVVAAPPPQHVIDAPGFRVIFCGRLVYWKGMHLGIPAFAQLAASVPSARLTIVGSGPEGPHWYAAAQRLDINDKVEWIPYLERPRLLETFRHHHAFLYPALHDPGSVAALDALSQGLPVVCLDIGGTGSFVDNTCGRLIAAKDAPAQVVIDRLADAMIALATDHALRASVAEGAAAQARQLSWAKLASNVLDTVAVVRATHSCRHVVPLREPPNARSGGSFHRPD